MKKLSACLLGFAISGCGGGGGASDPGAGGGTVATPILATASTVVGTNPGINPAWADRSSATGGRGSTIDGVECLVTETYHIHSYLMIIKDGATQRIPKDVGLTGCAYELHTHDYSGTIHVETSVEKRFLLGQFFSVWGYPLSRANVAGLSGGDIRFFVADAGVLSEVQGDPNIIEFKQRRSIYIVIGQPPATLPRMDWPSNI